MSKGRMRANFQVFRNVSCFMVAFWDGIDSKPLLFVIEPARTDSDQNPNIPNLDIPFYSPHSSIGHLLPPHCWDICCSRRLMYQCFQYVALASNRRLCYPNLLLGTFCWKGLKLTTKCYRKVDRCISTVLASSMSVSVLSFRGTRDIEMSHTKGQDLAKDGKGHKSLIIPPRQMQWCCLTQVYYGYKCTVASYKRRGSHVRQLRCARKQRHKTRRLQSCCHLSNVDIQ